MIIYNRTYIEQHKNTHEFKSVKKAFDWFIKHTYPTLNTQQKKKLKKAKRAHKKGRSLSIKRMKKILQTYGEFEVIYRFKAPG
ncbi:hypothetical protein [uncultured Microscilla sp.]|uniref:hypothetical protein n=1 Tax=uncultured Microscilla sp. TaxID=432653 RepID=UPI002632F32F|nr:hypothetical protein [uncultured Microscilla sp.]